MLASFSLMGSFGFGEGGKSMDVCSSCPLVDELICCRWEDGRGRRRLIGFITLEGYYALLYFSLMRLLVFVSGGVCILGILFSLYGSLFSPRREILRGGERIVDFFHLRIALPHCILPWWDLWV